MKDITNRYPNPEELKTQVLRTQELIFDFTKRISKLRKELNTFQQDIGV